MKIHNTTPAKRIFCLALILCCTLTMGACSFRDFDASAYTKSFLDAISKNDFTEYAKLTDSTEEKAKQEYEQLLESSVTNLLGNITVTDETKNNIREMFHTIYSKWSYEVGEAEKNSDGSFTIPVTMRQLTAFTGALKTTAERFEKRTGKSDNLNDNDYYNLYYQTFVEAVNENVAKGTYAEPATVKVKVAPSSSNSNLYELPADSISALYSAAMDMDSINKEADELSEKD